MTTTTPAQTRDPLPEGVTSAKFGQPCPTCGPREFTISSDGPGPMTRTAEPDADGRYTMQAHAEWCPVWSGESPKVTAPCCGAPVEDFDYRPAWWLVVPGLTHSGQVMDHHVLESRATVSQRAASTGRVRATEFDLITLRPCGHTTEGPAGRRVLADCANARLEAQQAEAAEILDGCADLLARVEAAGHGAVAEQYRQAVRGGAKTAAGLLVAVQTLVGEA